MMMKPALKKLSAWVEKTSLAIEVLYVVTGSKKIEKNVPLYIYMLIKNLPIYILLENNNKALL